MRHITVGEARALLRCTGDLLDGGMRPRDIAAAVDSGLMRRIRRQWYVDAADWRDLWGESRHRIHVVAAALDARGPFVASHLSAAALLGLPIYRVVPGRVHTLTDPRDRRSSPGVFRHEGPLGDGDVVEVDGIHCTSLARTALDVARTTSTEVALACVDGALGRVGGDPRRFDADAASTWFAEVQPRLMDAGARGIRHARSVFAIADGRAESPVESVTRLGLHRLGFGRLEVQIRVPAPTAGAYWVDLGLADGGVLIECDGDGKYLEEALRSGRSAEEAVLEEKRREDWIRGVTGARLIRFGASDVVTLEMLAARLAAFRIPLPRRPQPTLPRRPLAYGV